MAVVRNLAAGFAANVWTAVVQVAFVPVYIDLIGIEAYGLIGVYGFVQSALLILDLGLTPSLNRETARAFAGAVTPSDLRDALRSAELLLLAVGAATALLAWATAEPVSRSWLQLGGLPPDAAVHALTLMGALLAVRLLVSLYRGVLAGSQQFVWLGGVGAAFATLRGAGVVPVLWLAPSIEAFFLFQLAATAIEAAITGAKAWSLAREPRSARFSRVALRRLAPFATGLAVMTTMGLLLNQADKVLLSIWLPLGEFGHYALASSVTGALALALVPIGSLAYPQLNALVARGDRTGVVEAFRRFSWLVTLVTAPCVVVLAAFAERILLFWTRDAATAAAAAPFLAPLALGTMLNAALYVPGVLPLARGRSRALAAMNVVLVAIYLPVLAIVIGTYGPIAVPYAWLGINAVGVGLMLPLLASELPRGELLRWALLHAALPAAAGALAALTSAKA